ncbi:MAG: CpsD/CapB family tyrosine-protein kinase [Clostridia bacterium]|nr:CpsD/CapB family tyrosine-protein kinase [Clostridia bacterium]
MLKKNSDSAKGYGSSYGRSYSAYGGSGDMFAVQEAYKAIRTNIILSVVKDGCKKLVVTSSVPHEGKTTTALNLAISLAQAFKKVLLIDGDLRKSKIHRAFGISPDPGLTNVISGLADIKDAIQATKYQNLYCITSGITAPNPAEMLAGERMQAIVEGLEEHFDYIIFDTPPVNVVSDALPLIKMSDGVILIVRAGVTVYTDFEAALSSLEFIGAHIVGVIVNGDDGSDEGTYGQYGKYGKYGRYGRYGKNSKFGEKYDVNSSYGGYAGTASAKNGTEEAEKK